MSEFMRRIPACIQSGHFQLLVQHFLNTTYADSSVVTADEQCILIFRNDFFRIPDGQIIINRFPAAFCKKHHTFFVSFADYTKMILIHVCDVKRNKL